MNTTPIERAIAEKTDRKKRYEAAQRKRGLVRVSRWVPAGRVGDLDRLLASWCEDQGE